MSLPNNNGTVTSTPPTTPPTILPTSPSVSSSSTSTSLSSSTPLTSSTDSLSTSSSSSFSIPTSSITSGASAAASSTPAVTSAVVVTKTNSVDGGSTEIVIKTSTKLNTAAATTPADASTASDAAAAASSTAAAGLQSSNDKSSGNGKLSDGGRTAIAVVVPIVVVALLVLGGLWFWRKRKQSKNAEELRRKEMEEYGFNPNQDPTLAAVGGSTNGDEASTVREQDAGYRGWGTTSSNTRKASTTMSSNPGMARSDSGGNGYKGQPSPTGNMTQISDGHSGDPLVGHGDETIGALGAAPAASGNRGVNRGPSNASSAYSAANRSDVSAISGDGPLPNGSPPYAQDYMYPDDSNQNGWDGQPVIKEVSARRNTRIENPSIVPQQGNAGIAQNF